MSPIRILPLLAGLACAMPIHVGSNWTWRVVDLRTNLVEFRSARIIDSIPGDSTTLWSVAIFDSTNGKRDTARIITTRDGEQNWVEESPLLPIEPMPETDRTEIPQQGGLYGHMWGYVPFASLVRGDYVSQFYLTEGCGQLGVRMGGTYESRADASPLHELTVEAPVGVWSDSLGVERFRLRLQDWRLIRANGRNLAIADSLAIPDSGATRLWKSVSTDSDFIDGIPTVATRTTLTSWTILSKQPDSAGWARLRIRRAIDSFVPDEFDLRMNRFTGERRPARLDATLLPDDHWRRDLSDVDSGAYRFRSSFYDNRRKEGDGTSLTIETLARASRSGDLDSLHYSYVTTSTTGGRTATTSSLTIVTTLLSIDGKEVGNRITAIGPRALRGTARPSLAELVRTRPDAVVHWSDISGRRGTTTLARFTASRPSSGVLHLSIDLGDGTTWQGASLCLARP